MVDFRKRATIKDEGKYEKKMTWTKITQNYPASGLWSVEFSEVDFAGTRLCAKVLQRAFSIEATPLDPLERGPASREVPCMFLTSGTGTRLILATSNNEAQELKPSNAQASNTALIISPDSQFANRHFWHGEGVRIVECMG